MVQPCAHFPGTLQNAHMVFLFILLIYFVTHSWFLIYSILTVLLFSGRRTCFTIHIRYHCGFKGHLYPGRYSFSYLEGRISTWHFPYHVVPPARLQDLLLDSWNSLLKLFLKDPFSSRIILDGEPCKYRWLQKTEDESDGRILELF